MFQGMLFLEINLVNLKQTHPCIYILLIFTTCFVFFSCFENVIVVNCHVKTNSLLCLIVVLCLFGHHVRLNFANVFFAFEF